MSLFRLYGLYVCTDLIISRLKKRPFLLKIASRLRVSEGRAMLA